MRACGAGAQTKHCLCILPHDDKADEADCPRTGKSHGISRAGKAGAAKQEPPQKGRRSGNPARDGSGCPNPRKSEQGAPKDTPCFEHASDKGGRGRTHRKRHLADMAPSGNTYRPTDKEVRSRPERLGCVRGSRPSYRQATHASWPFLRNCPRRGCCIRTHNDRQDNCRPHKGP